MITSEAIHPGKSGAEGAQTAITRVGAVSKATRETGTGAVLFHGEHAKVGLRAVNDQIIRIKLFVGDRLDWTSTPAILAQENGEPVAVELSEQEGLYSVSFGRLRAEVATAPFALKIYDAQDRLLLDQQDLLWNQDGKAAFAAALDAQSHFYGLGEKTGFLDKKGEKYTMWNTDVYDPHVPDIEAIYQSIPYLVHFRYDRPAYGLLLDNPGKTVFDMRSYEDQYVLTMESGELDLYVIAGPSLKDVVTGYAGLTGKMPMPPKWAIGYQQSRYSYMNQEEVMELARSFRERNIPCDVIYLDIHYMHEYRVFTWDTNRFPKPKEMITQLQEMGFRIVPIVDPGVKKDPKYKVYQEGIAAGHFCSKLEGDVFNGKVWPGVSAFPDFTEDRTAEWWGDLHKFYIEHGIHGIWNDMNEPSVFETESKTMELDVVHGNNGNPKTHEEWHNLYGMLMSKATFEGLKRNLNGERPFVVTRAGYAGIQRYAAVWTGDNRSYWEHMAMSIPMVLNLGLSGVAFAGPDIGGFSHHASGELLARWTQMGALFPFCRNHAVLDSRRQEPWAFGPEVEAICREYIGLRYRLLPYIYTLFHQAAQSGLPIIRPLILEYPQDREVYNLCDQFLLGRDLLVAPVYRPGTSARAVYLPEGVWYNYWTGERYEGGRSILADAPLSVMPIYAREGAIIPEQALRQYTGESSSEPLQIHVYGDWAPGKFEFYEDDGSTFGYEQGAYRLTRLNWGRGASGALKLICIVAHDGLPQVEKQAVKVRVKQISERPSKVQVQTVGSFAQEVSWSYDERAQQLDIELSELGACEVSIQ
ncbi:TIM-barrel domain-containing protein [Paenibacillus sp. GCM10012307]|uniref:DUF5110 domain-containing protein n=1 Tax=Paenibacillus roseus TaxID=2798579 RepID=A0A934J0C2_9BACL|nr:TIM-barrel domain-containing protein [Paenibacillus roseus]MBJ6360390.1 DUF5110 domain-containing protein [Paenibacillus roseus]